MGNNDKARLFKVVLETNDHRNHILSEARNLKSVNAGGLDKVFTNQDLTL